MFDFEFHIFSFKEPTILMGLSRPTAAESTVSDLQLRTGETIIIQQVEPAGSQGQVLRRTIAADNSCLFNAFGYVTEKVRDQAMDVWSVGWIGWIPKDEKNNRFGWKIVTQIVSFGCQIGWITGAYPFFSWNSHSNTLRERQVVDTGNSLNHCPSSKKVWWMVYWMVYSPRYANLLANYPQVSAQPVRYRNCHFWATSRTLKVSFMCLTPMPSINRQFTKHRFITPTTI